MRPSLPALCALSLLALLATGCPKKTTPTPDAGGTSGGTTGGGDAGQDAGPVDAGPTACTRIDDCPAPLVCDDQLHYCVPPCTFDDLCGPGKRCDDVTKLCVAATACDPGAGFDTCANSSQDDYCYEIGGRCSCRPADGGGGFCQRVRTLCAPCAATADCSTCPTDDNDCNPDNFVYPAVCAPVGDGGSFCLRKATAASSCPGGYLSVSGLCVPQTGSCSGNPACATDEDCLHQLGNGHICDRASGVCKESCSFDYLSGTSLNCPPGQVCNVLPQFVLPDAGIASYGQGRCSAPCDAPTADDCAALGATAGLTFECYAERSGEKRCRPVNRDAGTPTCMDNVECPRTTDGGPYAGYCGKYQFACAYDCRDGLDPLSGRPYAENDCSPASGSDTSYKCQNSTCVEKTCVERGGAQFGRNGQLCCGEDRDRTGYLDGGFADLSHPANACIPGVDAGEYYDAPSPPFCAPYTCSDTLDLPDGGQLQGVEALIATCSSDFGLPQLDSSPNICMTMRGTQNVPTCLLAASNYAECPKGFTFGSPYLVSCTANSDCSEQYPDGGNSDAGFCKTDNYPDGGHSTYCACDQDERIDGGQGLSDPYNWGNECPASTRCYQKKTCAFTVGCEPSYNACKLPDGGLK